MAAKRKRRRGIPEPVKPAVSRTLPRMEACGIGGLGLLLVFFLYISWRKWPDPLIDFGRELYIPWRISHGAVLYRDLEEHYGPLSQYFNGLIFSFIGPGLMILVTANLVLLAGILTLLYLLCRRAWGPTAAFAATAVFISVFSFSQFTGISNYNYLTPYAHETTHGILVSLGLVAVLCRWIAAPTLRWSFLAGLLFGLCVVLKPEFMLSGTLLGMAALAVRLRYYSIPSVSSLLAGAGGVILPTLCFVTYFATTLPIRVAWMAASGAWLRFATEKPQETAGGIQLTFAGLDHPTNYLLEHTIATFIACLVIGAIAGLLWLSRHKLEHLLAIPLCVIAASGIAACSWSFIHWPEIGRCLLGLTLIYTAACIVIIFFRKQAIEDLRFEIPRLLLALLAVSLMTRMALNGRIYQYGFYQAAIAGSVLPAILVGELPKWMRLGARARTFLVVMVCALLLPGLVIVGRNSYGFLRLKTATVGEGIDRFFTFHRQVEPTGEIVAAVANYLNKGDKPKSLLVLPEGILVNYLTRIPSNTPFYFYLASSPQLIALFETNPPECVVIISRNLREYGIDRYGDKPGQGEEILRWLSEHYRQVAHAGDDPFDPRKRGAVFFKRKTE